MNIYMDIKKVVVKNKIIMYNINIKRGENICQQKCIKV